MSFALRGRENNWRKGKLDVRQSLTSELKTISVFCSQFSTACVSRMNAYCIFSARHSKGLPSISCCYISISLDIISGLILIELTHCAVW